jgi:AAA family ATP:ADP antiporter
VARRAFFGVEIRPGEGLVALLLAADLFLLLATYYVLKIAREPLVLLGGIGGAVMRNYARGAEAVTLMVVVPAYGWLANHVSPRRLVSWILAFFGVCLLVLRALARPGSAGFGFAFFVWLGIFSTMTIAQIWSLANDLFTEDEGLRLFPLVAAGGTLGAVAGSQLATQLIGRLGARDLMLVAALLLAGSLALTLVVVHRRVRPAASGGLDGATSGGFALILRDRYLFLIAGTIVLLNLVNSTGDFLLARLVAAHAAGDASWIGSFYGRFQTAVTAVTAVLQLFVVARVFRRVGVTRALFALPIVALAGYSAVAVAPVLLLTTLVKTVENSGDYSLQNTIQQALFLPTSRAAKYKAKTAIDTFVVRFGDLGSAALIAGLLAVGFGTAGIAAVNVCLAVLWFGAVVALARRYRHLTRVPEPAIHMSLRPI